MNDARMIWNRHAGWLAGSVLFLVSLASADVLVVDAAGGGSFTDLQPAIDAAVPGDTLLVKTGNYGPFALQEGLSIVSDEGATVVVLGNSSIQSVPVGQTAVVSGIELRGDSPWSSALVVFGCAGPVRLQDCKVRGTDGKDGGEFGNDGESGGPGMSVLSSLNVVLTSCDLVGGRGGDPVAPNMGGYSGDGRSGLYVEGSTVALHRCIVRGGRAGEDADGKIGAWAGYAGEGARVQGDTEFVAIYSLFQGGDGGDGGDFIGKSCSAGGTGLIVDSPAIARELACIFEAGTGGVWVNGSQKLDCDDGSPTLGSLESLQGSPRAVLCSRVARERTVHPIDFFGKEGDQVFLFASAYTSWDYQPFRSGVSLVIPFATGTNHVPLGTVPSGGTFTVSIRAPRVRAPLDERTIHYQALFLDVGGSPVWSNMQTLLVLDSQF